MIMELTQIFEKAKQFDNLDLMYSVIDSMMTEGRLKELDDAILSMDFGETSTDMMIGILVVTFPIKSKLESREWLFNCVVEHLKFRGEYERIVDGVGELKKWFWMKKWLWCWWKHRKDRCSFEVWKPANERSRWHCARCHPCGEEIDRLIQSLNENK